MANQRARAMRKAMTDGERRLWRALRGKQVEGLRFRRQHPIGPYIVDFVCLEKKLVVEVDGAQHFEQAAISHDLKRDRWLADEGYGVVRFTTLDVMRNTESVTETIWAILNGVITPTRRAQ